MVHTTHTAVRWCARARRQEPSRVLVHIRMLDKSAQLQQEAVGGARMAASGTIQRELLLAAAMLTRFWWRPGGSQSPRLHGSACVHRGARTCRT